MNIVDTTTTAIRSVRDIAGDIRVRVEALRQEGEGWILTEGSSANRTVRMSWTGVADETTIISRIADIVDGQNVRTVMIRTLIWACGSVHEDEMAAWQAHEGQEHMTWVCGCGAVSGCFTAENAGENCDEWNLRKCSDHSYSKMLDETQSMLETNGETYESDCKAGNYSRCIGCSGAKTLIDSATLRRTACLFCNGLGILNMDSAEHRAVYAHAKVLAAEFKVRHPGHRALPENLTR